MQIKTFRDKIRFIAFVLDNSTQGSIVTYFVDDGVGTRAVDPNEEPFVYPITAVFVFRQIGKIDHIHIGIIPRGETHEQ